MGPRFSSLYRPNPRFSGVLPDKADLRESPAGRPDETRGNLGKEAAMKVVTLSVGLPREVEWEGNTVLTSIFKEPVDRRLRVSTLNFDGDQQSDLTVHGGLDKAV